MATFTTPDESQKPKTLIIIVSIAIVAVIGGYLYCYECVDLLKVRRDILETLPDLLIKYSLIVIAIERSAFIYVNIFRRPGESKWTKRIERVSRAVDGKDVMNASGNIKNIVNKTFVRQLYKKENVILSELDSKTTIKPDELDSDGKGGVDPNVDIEDVRGYLDSVRQIYRFKLGDHQTITKRYASWIVFFAGIILAIFGISILGDLVYLPNMTECASIQCIGIRIFDVLFTGGLLGGGSASFNKLINTIQSALPSKNQNTQSEL